MLIQSVGVMRMKDSLGNWGIGWGSEGSCGWRSAFKWDLWKEWEYEEGGKIKWNWRRWMWKKCGGGFIYIE